MKLYEVIVHDCRHYKRDPVYLIYEYDAGRAKMEALRRAHAELPSTYEVIKVTERE